MFQQAGLFFKLCQYGKHAVEPNAGYHHHVPPEEFSEFMRYESDRIGSEIPGRTAEMDGMGKVTLTISIAACSS
jgi:hypothetical protein